MDTNSLWTLANLSRLVEWLNIFLAAALATKMWRMALQSTYRALFLYLVISPLLLLAFEFIPRNTNVYAYAFFGVMPLHWVLYFAVAYEIYRRVLEEHKGIASAGRWLVTGGMALSLLVTSATMLVDYYAGRQKYPVLNTFLVADRAVNTALALLLIILLAFLIYFPVLLRRNSLYIVSGLTIFFLFRALLLLIRNLLGPETYLVLSTTNQVLYLVITATWFVKLIPNALNELSGPRTTVPKERAEEMLRQLGQMNEVLLRSGGR